MRLDKRLIMDFIVRIRQGIYTTRFRRPSVDITEGRRRYRQRSEAEKTITRINVNCCLKQRCLCQHWITELFPRFSFAHFAFFLLDVLRLGEFQCPTLSFFYHNIAGENSRRGKCVCNVKAEISRTKIGLHPVYTVMY